MSLCSIRSHSIEEFVFCICGRLLICHSVLLLIPVFSEKSLPDTNGDSSLAYLMLSCLQCCNTYVLNLFFNSTSFCFVLCVASHPVQSNLESRVNQIVCLSVCLSIWSAYLSHGHEWLNTLRHSPEDASIFWKVFAEHQLSE